MTITSGQPRRSGLRNKIIAWTFIPTAIILGAIALVNFYAYGQVTEKLVIERNQEMTKILADQLSAELEEYVHTLSVIDAYYEIDPTDFHFQPDPDGPSIGWLQPFDGGVLMLNSIGDVAYGHDSRAQLGTFAFSELDAYQSTVQERKPIWSDIEQVGGRDVIILFVPMIGAEGDVQGTLVGMFLVEGGTKTRTSDFYVTIFAKLKIASRENVYVVDRNGRAILHTDTYRIGEDIAGQAIVQRVMNSEVGGIRTRDLQGHEIVASFAPVPGTPWSLVTEESWQELTQVSQQYRQLLLILLGLGGVLPVVVVTVGVRRITRPIVDLIRAAQGVAGGNFGQRIEAGTGDELEEMAAQFNLMAGELQESYATLERRVADRTRELAALNAVSAVVNRSLDLEEILENALDMTLEVTGMEAGRALWLGSGQSPICLARRNLPPDLLSCASELSSGSNPTQSTMRVERPVARRINEYPAGPLKAAAVHEGFQLMVTVPLTTKGRLLGTLDLLSKDLLDMTKEELGLLAGIGQQVGMAVENAQLYEQAEGAAAAAERSRLARDLHDAVSQTLFSASLIADILPRLWEKNPAEARRRLEQVRQLTRGALAEMRTLLLELRPSVLEEAPLDELLRQLTDAVAGRAMLQVDLQLNGSCTMPVVVKEAFYRIAQEALNNVVKHADACSVAVGLRCLTEDSPDDVQVDMWIVDDGKGFDPARIPPDHLGVGIMRERAEGVDAYLALKSTPGAGTKIRVVWNQNHTGRDRDAIAGSDSSHVSR
jgi:nitrate/nitrite-specific signal transduction histidine kinase